MDGWFRHGCGRGAMSGGHTWGVWRALSQEASHVTSGSLLGLMNLILGEGKQLKGLWALGLRLESAGCAVHGPSPWEVLRWWEKAAEL